MKTCRFCEREIGDHDKICVNCGYNPQTDTMTASFVKKPKVSGSRGKQALLGSGVKTFAFWGLMLIIFSLGVKYQGKIGDVLWQGKNLVSGKKVSNLAQASGKARQNKAIRLIDVRSYKTSEVTPAGKDKKIEGIFFDPQGKSYAVINGQLISEQESLGNMAVKKINHDSVEVVEDGRQKVLKVNP
jgi:hypothetical protein